jgi:hypothetical protein
MLQLLEKGSLLRKLAQQQGKSSAVAMYGSLKNMAERLLESLRNWRWAQAAYQGRRVMMNLFICHDTRARTWRNKKPS